MGIREKYKNIPPLPKNIKEKIQDLETIFKRNKVKIAYIFGSFLNREDPEDIDIGFLSDGDYFGLYEDMKKLLNTERIDLIDLSQVSPFFALHIISSGKLIYKEDVGTENTYEMKILKICQDLEIFRKKQVSILKREFYDL